MSAALDPARAILCPACRAEIAPGFLSCPVCRWLVHGERLTSLAAEAEAAVAAGRLSEAVAAWRNAVDLLPPGAKQVEVIRQTINELSHAIDRNEDRTPPAPTSPDGRRRRFAAAPALAGLGSLALVIWKFKAVALLLLGKGKLLLAGLGNAGTMLSMLVSLGVYWQVWGWKFALGLIGSMYVHEMGHIHALRRFGIKSSAPAFIPGLGALVRLKQSPANPVEDARVGLAGPLWGLAAAVAVYAAYLLSGWASLSAIARAAAWLNLFNLLPILPFDGGRGFRALSRSQRWVVVGVIGLFWATVGDGLLVLLLLVAAWQAFATPATGIPADRRALLHYVVLVVALSLLSAIHVPGLRDAPGVSSDSGPRSAMVSD